jgi:uncharacterized protein (TIGR00369 family)
MQASGSTPKFSGDDDARYGWLYGRGEPPPYLSMLGCRLQTLGQGECVVHWTPPLTILNTGGVVQGGFIAAVLDLTSAIASATCDIGVATATVRLDIEYFRPIQADGSRSYVSNGNVVNKSRRWITSDASIVAPDSKLCARGRHLIAIVESSQPQKPADDK